MAFCPRSGGEDCFPAHRASRNPPRRCPFPPFRSSRPKFTGSGKKKTWRWSEQNISFLYFCLPVFRLWRLSILLTEMNANPVAYVHSLPAPTCCDVATDDVLVVGLVAGYLFVWGTCRPLFRLEIVYFRVWLDVYGEGGDSVFSEMFVPMYQPARRHNTNLDCSLKTTNVGLNAHILTTTFSASERKVTRSCSIFAIPF